MKFDFIVTNRTAVVDGDPRVLNKDVEMPKGIASIHWFGKRGEICFPMDDYGKQPENEEFFSDELPKYQWIVTEHAKAKQRDEEKIAKAKAARKEADRLEQEAREAQVNGE